MLCQQAQDRADRIGVLCEGIAAVHDIDQDTRLAAPVAADVVVEPLDSGRQAAAQRLQIVLARHARLAQIDFVQGIGNPIGLQLELRRGGRERAVRLGDTGIGERKTTGHVDLVITQIDHKIVIHLRLVRHGVIERAQQDIVEAECPNPGQDAQFVRQGLPDTRTHRVFTQGQIDQIGVDATEFFYLLLCPRQDGMGIFQACLRGRQGHARRDGALNLA